MRGVTRNGAGIPGTDVRQTLRPSAVTGVSVAAAMLLLFACYALKSGCFGPVFDENGASGPDAFLRGSTRLCYTDIQTLWSSRALFNHVFPYLHGGLVQGVALPPGFLEYPVLSGVAIYLLALPARTDLEFFNLSALVLASCGIVVVYLLAKCAGWRVLWFALAPALVLYSFLNWDLLVVLAMVGALLCIRRAASTGDGAVAGQLSGRWLAAGAVLIAAGGALKFYPLMFTLPIALWIALGVRGGPSAPAPRRWRAAVLFAVGTAAVFLLINLPFMILDYDGWAAAYLFQWTRPIDFTTNSIWYWGSRPRSVDDVALQHFLSLASTGTTAAGLLLAAAAGALVWRLRGTYPWLQVCGAMLCVYLLLNKVHSPQYMLWLLPFFVLLRVRWGWIAAYFVADVCIGLGCLLMFSKGLDINSGITAQLLMIGVWGRAGLLVGLAPVFLLARPAWRDASRRTDAMPTGLNRRGTRKIELAAR